MKKCLKNCLLGCIIAVMFIGMLLIGGCNKNPWDSKKEDKGFYYSLIGDDRNPASLTNRATGAAILGLVNEDEEIEELVIPEKLGKYPVKKIGGSSLAGIGAAEHFYGINAKNVKRIVINNELKLLTDGIYNFNGDLILNTPIIFQSPALFPLCGSIQINYETSLIENYKDRVETLFQDQKEVLFDASGGEQFTYSTIIKPDRLLLKPEDPTKEGYTFGGWFTEDSYETQWNFETDIVTENITLYAKWI